MEIVKNKILKYKNYYWKIWKETVLLIVIIILSSEKFLIIFRLLYLFESWNGQIKINIGQG